MSWRYRIRKRIIDGKPWYDVVEYYTTPLGKSWTAGGMACGESKKEVIKCLRMMLDDCKHSNAFIDNEK